MSKTLSPSARIIGRKIAICRWLHAADLEDTVLDVLLWICFVNSASSEADDSCSAQTWAIRFGHDIVPHFVAGRCSPCR